MSRKITKENFERFSFENSGDNKDNPELDEKLLQSLSRLLAWDYANESWQMIISDNDGRLLVSTSPTKASSNVSSNPNITTVASNILTENPDRKQAIIQNTGGVSVYLGFGETATITKGFLLIPDAIFISDVWLGYISAITATGTSTLSIQEMS